MAVKKQFCATLKRMKFVQFLGEVGFQPERAGKKAAPLDFLIKKGLKIPPGFVVSSGANVRSAELKHEILSAISKVGGYPVAVRSSSNLEDLGDASFAGLYDTFLNVRSDDELVEKIEKCFESGRSDRVQAYLKSKKMSAESLDVSVLVQPMVDAEVAGVFFGIHPTEGKEEEAYIEACRGLGEKLVSGHTNPTSYSVSLLTGAVLKKTESSEGDCLSQSSIQELVEVSLNIMAEFGLPQDIEWVVDRTGTLWILQSRPITRIQWRTDVEEYTNADFKDGGVSASVCTPLMFSLYEAAMQTSMQSYMQKIKLLSRRSEQKTWIKMFYGRAYWNASEVKRRLFKVPGFDEQSFDLDLGIQKKYGPKGPRRVPTNLWTVLPVIPVALALEKEYCERLDFTDQYLEKIYLPRERTLRAKLRVKGALDATVLEILELQWKTECDYFSTIYSNTNLQGDFKKFLREQEKKYGFEADLPKLFSGVDGITHIQIQQDWVDMVSLVKREGFESSEFLRAKITFIERHGFHADRELDLSTPRWHEIPDLIEARVQELMNASSRLVNPSQTQVLQREQFEKEKKRVLDSIRSASARKKFVRELERVRLYLRRREEMREVSTRAYSLCREAILKLASDWVNREWIKNSSEIFFFTRRELIQVLEGKTIVVNLMRFVQTRERFYRAYRNLSPPNELGFETAVIESAEWDTDNGTRQLKGLGCSPGVTRGLVRVVSTLEDAYRLKEGEILVTRFTDPGWTAVLGLVSGVVTEVGGMLSHAAVIGRELGVPAILNLPKATELLKTGDQIEMNGSSGEIRIVSQSSS